MKNTGVSLSTAARFRKPSFAALVPYLSFIIIFLFFSITAFDRFLTYRNMTIILQQSATLMIVAFGMHFVIATGSIDLSVGSIVAISGMVAAGVATQYGLWGLLLGVLIGALFGLFNGAVVTWAKIPSFITTLGTMMMARGMTILYSRSNPIPTHPSLDFLGMYPSIVYVTAVVFAIAFVLYNYTSFGRYTLAVGGDERVSHLNGVPVNKVKVLAFLLSGLFAGLGGVITASRLGAATPTAGQGFETLVISSVVLGGTPLTGGVGAIQNTIVGALITGMLVNGLVILGVSSEAQQIIRGLILIGAVFVSLDRKKIGIIK